MVILVCGNLRLPTKDEEIIYRTIQRTFEEKGKGFIAWLKNGKLMVDTDVLAQLLNPTLNESLVMPASSPQWVLQGQTNLPLASSDQGSCVEQPPGRKPGCGWTNVNLQQQRAYVGDQGIEMADNDLLLLKTRINNGVVSFDESDIEVRFPADWQVPVKILEDLKSKRLDGRLFIISDEKGNLKCTVKKLGVKDLVVGAKDKAVAFITSKGKSSSKPENKFV